MSLRKDLTGCVVDQLKVLRLEQRTSKGARWECQCSCGAIVSKSGTQLCKSRGKYHVSCGCTRARNVRKARWTGYKDIPGTYLKQLQANARNRGIEYAVSPEYLWFVFEQQEGRCSLSSYPIGFADTTASVDRIDSTTGYVEGNIQWLHKTVNGMKWDFTLSEFTKFCRLVTYPLIHDNSADSCVPALHHKNWNGVGNIPRDFYTRYRRQAAKRGIGFDITIEGLWELFVRQRGYCAMTGLPLVVGTTLVEVTASIDRVDNHIGYTPGNLQWVHKDFNSKLRRDLDLFDVVSWCSLVVHNLSPRGQDEFETVQEGIRSRIQPGV